MKYDFGPLEDFLKSKGVSSIEYEEYLKPLRKLSNTKRYGLVWEEPNDDSYAADNNVSILKDNFSFLKEVEDKKICKDDLGNTNLLIEGDNYHALKALQYTHKGKIDIIYIDPPYNTGKEFVYNDKIIDSMHEYRHSKWLSFMNKRLRLAKELLTDIGVIFISVDDNEQANLKLLCDSVFGESHFLGCLVQLKGNSDLKNKNIQKNQDYVLAYSMQKADTTKVVSSKSVKTYEVFEDNFGWFYLSGGLTNGQKDIILNRRKHLGYTIYYNPKTKDIIPLFDYDKEVCQYSNIESEVYIYESKELLDKGYIKIRPPKKQGKLGAWVWGMDTFQEEKNRIVVTKNNSIKIKTYLDKDLYSQINKTDNGNYITVIKESNISSLLDYPTSEGTVQLKKIFKNKVPFDYPKNVDMLKYLISVYTKKEDITVLDFFAGSGTTAQAVLELNEEDNGNRKFILCTNNEISSENELKFLLDEGLIQIAPQKKNKKEYNLWKARVEDFKNSEEYKEILQSEKYKNFGICRSVTYPRIQTVITGIRGDGSKYSDGISSNLNYYVIDLVKNSNDEILNNRNLINKCTDLIAIKEDCFEKSSGVIDSDGTELPYELLLGKDKAVLLLEKYPIYDSDIENAVDYLGLRGESKKVIYSSFIGFDETYSNSIEHNLLPQEVIDVLKFEEE